MQQNQKLTITEAGGISAAVLVAIAIPVFTSQLEKSRDSVSISNIRAAYAEAASSYLTANGAAVAKVGNVTVNAKSGDTQSVQVENVVLKGQATGFSGMEKELSFTHSLSDSSTEGGTPGTYTALFTFNLADGACTLTSLTAAGGGTP